MIIAFSLIFLCLAAHTKAQSCNILARCEGLKKAPGCSDDIKQEQVYKCIKEVLKKDCHTDKMITAYSQFVTLANTAICKKKELKDEFEKKPECWTSLRDCVVEKKVALVKENVNDICKEKKNVENECITEKCKDVQTNFKNLAYEGEKCGNNGAVHVLHVMSLLSLLFLIYII